MAGIVLPLTKSSTPFATQPQQQLGAKAARKLD